MFNKNIVDLLTQMGDLLELSNDNPFRIRAFRRGAETIDSMSEDLSKMDRKQLLEIPGIGQGIADLIESLQKNKPIPELEKLKKKFPEGLLKMMNLQGLGPKRAAFLFKELKIDSLDKLAAAAKSNRLVELKGFGAKLQDSLLKNISFTAEASKRMLLSDALVNAAHIKEYLSTWSGLADLEAAGSLRRWKETVGDLDFVCSSKNPAGAIKHFLSYNQIERVLASGGTKASVYLKSGLQCDFRVVSEKAFGAAWLYFSGSKEHNVRLRERAQKMRLTLNEYGLFKINDTKKTNPVASRTEEDIYKALGLVWIPPELREDRGEIEAAANNSLPDLVTEKDVLGDFHNHTDRSDGNDTLEAMVKTAHAKGWKWFVSADHSPSLKIANGLSTEELRKKKRDIERLNDEYKDFPILCGSEVDILGAGDLDYSSEALSEIDCVVGSVHSRFNQTEEEMTERICRAIENPHMDIVGHLTGRLLGKRDSYHVNVEAVLQKAKATRTAIEINGQPERQELQDFHVRRAIELGVPLALTTDAHSTKQLDNMVLAIHIARRGWAERKNIINAFKYKELLAWLKR